MVFRDRHNGSGACRFQNSAERPEHFTFRMEAFQQSRAWPAKIITDR